MNKEFTRLLVLAAVLFFTVFGEPASAELKDIDSTHRAYTEITYLEENNVIKGDGNGNFNPNDYLQRSEAAAMIGRALGLDGTQRTTSFDDVGKSSFASGYIQSAYEESILNGTGGGKFSPNKIVTRGQMAIMLANAYSLPTTNDNYFIDKPKGGSSYDAINKVAAAGISNGIDGWSFKPHANLTRADFAIFLARAMEPGFRVQVSPTSSITIVLDAGHGGKDSGAVGNGLKEKDINLDTALKAEQKLKDKGFNVVMTRKTDVFFELYERVDIANEANGNAFISIHTNAGGGTGTETFIYNGASVQSQELIDESRKLAIAIQNRMIAMLDMTDRGVKDANFHVLRENTEMPAVLAELGFIDDRHDANKLKEPKWREKAAEAISIGVLDYYMQK